MAAMQEQHTDQFVALAREVSNYFPQLDLRFTLQDGSNRVRYSAAHVSRKVFELELGRKNTQTLVHEAIFKLKEVARIYDA